MFRCFLICICIMKKEGNLSFKFTRIMDRCGRGYGNVELSYFYFWYIIKIGFEFVIFYFYFLSYSNVFNLILFVCLNYGNYDKLI